MLKNEEQSLLEETEFAQPAIFALQVGLTALWKSWGIKPDAIVGHSAGEVAAAYASGALSIEQAVRVIYHRSRIYSKKQQAWASLRRSVFRWKMSSRF